MEFSLPLCSARSLSLKHLCDTRWACWFEAIRAVDQNYPVLFEFHEKISAESPTAKDTANP